MPLRDHSSMTTLYEPPIRLTPTLHITKWQFPLKLVDTHKWMAKYGESERFAHILYTPSSLYVNLIQDLTWWLRPDHPMAPRRPATLPCRVWCHGLGLTTTTFQHPSMAWHRSEVHRNPVLQPWADLCHSLRKMIWTSQLRCFFNSRSLSFNIFNFQTVHPPSRCNGIRIKWWTSAAVLRCLDVFAEQKHALHAHLWCLNCFIVIEAPSPLCICQQIRSCLPIWGIKTKSELQMLSAPCVPGKLPNPGNPTTESISPN